MASDGIDEEDGSKQTSWHQEKMIGAWVKGKTNILFIFVALWHVLESCNWEG
jgi:hypothetical protein